MPRNESHIELLRSIKNGSIEKLYDLDKINEIDGLETERGMEMLFLIIAKNKYGILPTGKQLISECNFNLYPTINELLRIKPPIIAKPSIMYYLEVFGDPELNYKLPPNLEYAISNSDKYRSGRRSRSSSWEKRFGNPEASAFPRHFMALVQEDGKPIIGYRIFPHLISHPDKIKPSTQILTKF